MRIKVDKDDCIGCELCVQICSAVFEMKDEIAVVISDPVPEDEKSSTAEAAETCPTDAIIIVDDA